MINTIIMDALRCVLLILSRDGELTLYFITKLNSVIWSMAVIAFILSAGIYFSFKNKFFQITGIRKILHNTILPSHGRSKSEIKKEFHSMSMVLASCLGTGNITGVASALVSGGAGAVFWMWVSAFFGMMLSYTENIYGFRNRCFKNGYCQSGGMYYIENFSPKTAAVYAVLCTLSSFCMGNAVQTGTMASSLYDSFGTKKAVTGLITAALIFIIVFGGAKKLFNFSGKLIPPAALFYTAASLLIIFRHSQRIPGAFCEIFRSAFGVNGIRGGINGILVKKSVSSGLRRGVFSNEAGLGVSPMAHAPACMKNEEVQGSWGIAEVFIDTFLICSLTAFAVLCSDSWASGAVLNEETLINSVFNECFGDIGKMLVSVSVVIFAFMTVAGWSFYGETSYVYVFGNRGKNIYRILYAALIPLFSVLKNEALWAFADTVNGLMMIINIVSLILIQFDQSELRQNLQK